jgi:hypothetical protein
VVRHIFQACPVWIYTQSNITSINLKLRNIHFKQIAKTIPTGKNLAVIFFIIHFILYAIDFPVCTILFLDMSCFHCAVWCSYRCIVFSKFVKALSHYWVWEKRMRSHGQKWRTSSGRACGLMFSW